MTGNISSHRQWHFHHIHLLLVLVKIRWNSYSMRNMWLFVTVWSMLSIVWCNLSY